MIPICMIYNKAIEIIMDTNIYLIKMMTMMMMIIIVIIIINDNNNDNNK